MPNNRPGTLGVEVEAGREVDCHRHCAGRSGIGSVYQIGRATGFTGRSTPHIAAIVGDHAPATQITVDVAHRAARRAHSGDVSAIDVDSRHRDIAVANVTPIARAAVA